MGLLDFLNRRSGYRWSLYVTVNGKELRYALHQQSAAGNAYRVMSYYANGGRPVPPWSLYLNFNKKHKSFQLLPEHFSPDGENLSDTLIRQIEAIDPEWEEWRLRGPGPVFVDALTGRQIRLEPVDIMKVLNDRFAGKPKELTFYDVMNDVFGRRVP